MTDLGSLVEDLRAGDGNGCRQANAVMAAAADALDSIVARLSDAEARLSGIRELHSSLADDAGGDWSFREYTNEILER